MIHPSFGETIGESEAVVAELDDDVTEQNINEDNFYRLHHNDTVEIDGMTSARAWGIRMENHVMKKAIMNDIIIFRISKIKRYLTYSVIRKGKIVRVMKK